MKVIAKLVDASRSNEMLIAIASRLSVYVYTSLQHGRYNEAIRW